MTYRENDAIWVEAEDIDSDWCFECGRPMHRCSCFCPACGDYADDCTCSKVPEMLRLPDGV